MLTNNLNTWNLLFLLLSHLFRWCVHMDQHAHHRPCKSRFFSMAYAFRICDLFNNILTLRSCLFSSFYFLYSVESHIGKNLSADQESFITSLRLIRLEIILYSIPIEYSKGSVTCCSFLNRGIQTQTGAVCCKLITNTYCTVWFAMKTSIMTLADLAFLTVLH